MRQETINIYTFEELSDGAKETAIEWYRKGQEYFWVEESLKSLEAFCELFSGVSVRDYSLSIWGHSYIKLGFNTDFDERELKGNRLRTYLINNIPDKILKDWQNCPLTGYCVDWNALKPVIDFIAKPDDSSFEELMQECADNVHAAIIDDMEHQSSDEYISEHIIANEYEFTENGKIY